MSSYFNPLSWTRAQKNREALEKTNPQNPVFNEDDETFLHRITSQEAAAQPLPDPEPTVITDDGKEREATTTQKEAAEKILPMSPQPVDEESQEQQEDKDNKPAETGKPKRTWGSYIPSVPIPSMPSLTSKKAEKDLKPAEEGRTEALSEDDNLPESKETSEEPTSELEAVNEGSSKEGEAQSTIDKDELVEEDTEEGSKDEVQEEVSDKVKQETQTESEEEPKDQPKEETEQEAVEELEEIDVEEINKERVGTAEPSQDTTEDSAKDAEAESEPKTEEISTEPKSTEDTEAKTEGNATEVKSTDKPETDKEDGEKTAEPTQRTWASYIPAMPSLGKGSKGKETASDIADAATSSSAQNDDERDVSVLLDRLDLSAINNRVFSISQESQKLLQSFTLILKDMVNGVPTAKDDLETLVKDNERQLEQMFGNMPPFVQTLVKSLPSRFAGSLGPEVMAMASEKPGNDLRARMEAASRPGAAGPSIANLDIKQKQKKKRDTPGVKDLASEKGAVASMLQSILNFLKVRFPAFMTGTNVLMSLAVFILLFVFYYCHKRGRETRLLKESESARGSAEVSEVDSDEESEVEDEKNVEPVAVETAETEKAETAEKDDDTKDEKLEVADSDELTAEEAQKILEQSEPAEVALPDKKEEPELEGSGLEKA